VVAVALVARTLDLDAVAQTLGAARSDLWGGALALVLYAGAFALRAGVWSRLVAELPFTHALSALHVSLGANHVLPFRLGETLRVTTVVRRTRVSFAAATASTVTLRSGDMVAVVGIAALLGPRVTGTVVGGRMWLLFGPALAVFALGAVWLRGVNAGQACPPALLLVAGAAAGASWVLESAVLWQTARWADLEVSFLDAVLVTAVTIAAQAVAIAPAGVGTYEAATTAAFVSLGAGPGPALAAALTAHALKTAYALVTGALALFAPAPGALGRLRLASLSAPRVRGGEPRAPTDSAPVLLFLPARDEEPTVAAVVRRVPESVLGHPVETVVVDDGSSDGTAPAAAGAGADVVSLRDPRGLGAAVRTGLREATARGAAAVAFCDADGEYAPEELERLVGPVLAGAADYVVGTRLAGHKRGRSRRNPERSARGSGMTPSVRMPVHRRTGNIVLTRMLSFMARTTLSDGQSGFRALSAEAARDAEIIHDFNYAQVLTLDLLAKGYRYAEVPISYRHRTTGRSFVRLTGYLRAVAPAVHRELNDVPALTATLSPRQRG
jgi:uncharacterized membrane protein YbhN (UPF0104 family)